MVEPSLLLSLFHQYQLHLFYPYHLFNPRLTFHQEQVFALRLPTSYFYAPYPSTLLLHQLRQHLPIINQLSNSTFHSFTLLNRYYYCDCYDFPCFYSYHLHHHPYYFVSILNHIISFMQGCHWSYGCGHSCMAHLSLEGKSDRCHSWRDWQWQNNTDCPGYQVFHLMYREHSRNAPCVNPWAT